MVLKYLRFYGEKFTSKTKEEKQNNKPKINSTAKKRERNKEP